MNIGGWGTIASKRGGVSVHLYNISDESWGTAE